MVATYAINVYPLRYPYVVFYDTLPERHAGLVSAKRCEIMNHIKLQFVMVMARILLIGGGRTTRVEFRGDGVNDTLDLCEDNQH